MMSRSVQPSPRSVLGATLIGAGSLITVRWIKSPTAGAWPVCWALVGAVLILVGLHSVLGRTARPQPTGRDLRLSRAQKLGSDSAFASRKRCGKYRAEFDTVESRTAQTKRCAHR